MHDDGSHDDDRDDDDDERRLFKSPVGPDWRCRGCVVMIIMMTVGDADDAR